MIDLPSNWSDWALTGELGSGAYSVVYEAVRKDDPSIRCAIKIITVPQDEDEIKDLMAEGFTLELTKTYFDEAIKGFIHEIKLMEHLKGMQNIVSIEDYKVTPQENGIGNYIFIRMELLSSLEQYLSDKTLSEEEVLQIGVDICNALVFCESQKIIHRDIKPANIFACDRFGSHVFFKLGDFGIARNLEGKTSNMSAKGTPNYMAPEVAAGLPYKSTADIYSLGLTLYWLLNNHRLPFYPQTQLITPSARREALDKRLSGEQLPSPANASTDASAIVLKACAYHTEDRYQSAQDMKNDLQRLLERKRLALGPRTHRAAQNHESFSDNKTTHIESNDKPSVKKKKIILVPLIALLLLFTACEILHFINIWSPPWHPSAPSDNPESVETISPTEEATDSDGIGITDTATGQSSSSVQNTPALTELFYTDDTPTEEVETFVSTETDGQQMNEDSPEDASQEIQIEDEFSSLESSELSESSASFLTMLSAEAGDGSFSASLINTSSEVKQVTYSYNTVEPWYYQPQLWTIYECVNTSAFSITPSESSSEIGILCFPSVVGTNETFFVLCPEGTDSSAISFIISYQLPCEALHVSNNVDIASEDWAIVEDGRTDSAHTWIVEHDTQLWMIHVEYIILLIDENGLISEIYFPVLPDFTIHIILPPREPLIITDTNLSTKKGDVVLYAWGNPH